MIPEAQWRRAAKNLPLEYQIEFCHYAYEVGNLAAFEEISKSAFVRCKYRRLEVPYVSRPWLYFIQTLFFLGIKYTKNIAIGSKFL